MRKNERLSFDRFASIMAVVLLHVSSCEMFTFGDVLHEAKQKREQALESAQYGPTSLLIFYFSYSFPLKLKIDILVNKQAFI